MGFHVKFDIRVRGGGDSLEVVQFSVSEYYSRKSRFGDYSAGFILLDEDRIEQDRAANRSPEKEIGASPIEVILQRPNFEGLLLRLHPGMEQHYVAAENANRMLKKKWPTYRKNADRMAFQKRFDINDLRRLARHDDEIEKLSLKLRLL